MANPKTGTLDLNANRWAPFVYTIDFQGYDYSAAAFAMQVRLVKDAAGTPLVSLSTVASSSTEGVAMTGVDTDANGVPTTHISIRINETTIDGLPEPSELGDDVVLYYDLQITPSGGDKYRSLEGMFTVKAGVTH